jgi:hypothetical protein
MLEAVEKLSTGLWRNRLSQNYPQDAVDKLSEFSTNPRG